MSKTQHEIEEVIDETAQKPRSNLDIQDITKSALKNEETVIRQEENSLEVSLSHQHVEKPKS
jgi:hypothetical protein